jgi:ubiquitin C-terminal hydrolase
MQTNKLDTKRSQDEKQPSPQPKNQDRESQISKHPNTLRTEFRTSTSQTSISSPRLLKRNSSSSLNPKPNFSLLPPLQTKRVTSLNTPIERLKSCDSINVKSIHYELELLINETPTGRDVVENISKYINGQSGLGVAGLINHGNTVFFIIIKCFLNSILQCVCTIKSLAGYFQSGDYKQDLSERGQKGGCAVAFADFLKRYMSAGKGTSVSPLEIKQAVSRAAPQFMGNRQHDAQGFFNYNIEFLRIFVDCLHQDLNLVQGVPRYTYASTEFDKLT